MASAGVRAAQDPPDRTEVVSEDAHTRVIRVTADGRTMIRKEPLGPDADRRVRHESAVLARLVGVAGVVQLAAEASADSGAVVLADAGSVGLATVGNPMPVEQLVGLALGLAQAVAGMHVRGVMHRNICPANIVLAADGAPCLVGFGLARAVAEVRPEFTHHSQIVGELSYLAPEQTGRTGRSVDERADLYALGATMYELATGAPPFGWGDPLRLIRDHLTRMPAAPAVVNPTVPEPLSQIILHLLEKEPDRRYQTAEGLAHDLQHLHDTETAARREPRADRWRVGERDVGMRLAPPSRLIGRDEEVAALETAFEEAMAGDCAGVLISGAPGVGKTALIDQLRPVVTGRDGWFVAGKFDQYRRDLEFDGAHQAFRALARLLLAEPDDELALVRERILQALGPNVGLATAMVPEFATLLSVPPDPGDPLTAQARVQWASLQVLRAVASRKRPVLLFLDDLQWAGRTPVVVDAVLGGEPVDGLLLVAAHRELDAAHPLAAPLSRWRTDARVRTLRLDNLSASDVVEMVAEMLRVEPGVAAGLAELIAPETRGSPYETVELLNALRRAGLLTPASGGWRWDTAAVRTHLGSSEPAQLFATRVAALPIAAQQVVQAMACLGGRAELTMLATVAGTSPVEVEQHLGPALADRLLVAEPEAVRFRHDRIYEAVLTTMDGQRRSELHLAMGRRLAGVGPLFAVAAEQYLPVVDRVTDPAERRQVLALLRRAADQAGLIGKHLLVNRLLEAALRLIDPAETSTLVAVRTAYQAALFSAGRLDEADEQYQAINAIEPTPVVLADAAAVQVRSLAHRGRYAEAITLGVNLLRRLGVAVPPAEQLGADLDNQFRHLHAWLERTEDDAELSRPEITDPTLLATARVLDPILPVAFLAADPVTHVWLGLEAVRIWLDHGPAPNLLGPASDAAFAAVIQRGADAATWFRALRRMVALGEARGYEPGTSQARFLYAAVSWRVEPVDDAAAGAQRAREGLIAGGDLTRAAYSYLPAVCYLLECAPTLDDFAAEVRAGQAFTMRTGNESTGHRLDGYRWLAERLRGDSSTATQPISTEGYGGNLPAVLHAHTSGAVAAAIFGDQAGLLRHTAAALPMAQRFPASYPLPVIRLVHGLLLAEQARNSEGEHRQGLITELDDVINWLAARAREVPANSGHLVPLLEAERAWVVGDVISAELGFDTALREAEARQRPWHQALTAEHAARFYLARGLSRVGNHLLTQARTQYAAWGASAKVAQLDWAYPALQPATAGHRGAPSTTVGAATPVTSATIDLLGILSASQALSSETTLARLHAGVADILAAMTGATGVRLLLWSEEQHHWFVPTSRGATPLVAGREHTVPMTVLRYLHRSGEPLLVADATGDDRFARDPYFADLSRCALLAVPIHSRGSLRAALVLENRLLRGAFTADRLDAVTLVAGQLAVSLDNAQLYAELTASRQRIVTTADTTRKRIERDLHDGAQQRLVSLALQLSVAQAAIRPDQPDLAAALTHAATEANAATQELREIAHGLHPGILSTSGLGAALRTLARRALIPVDLDVRIPGRLPEPVEIGAYYLIAEALTNTAKHANATAVTVTVTVDNDLLQATVEDDGVGGADLTHGTGLLGLKDRAEALGGHLTLDSPPGAGTRLHAQLPLTTPDDSPNAAVAPPR